MNRPEAALLCLALVAACDSKPTEGTPSAKPSQSAAAKPSASASAAKSAAPAPSAAPSAASSADDDAEPAGAKKFESAEAFLKTWKGLDGSAVQPVPSYELFHFTGPKDIKWPPRADKTAWAALSVGGKPMALLMANPQQDEGAQCPTMAEAKAKLGAGAVGGAKVVSESTFEVPTSEKDDKTTTWGETIELIVWDKVQGQGGFFVHKVFDHGDDATHICCTAGAPGDAPDMKGLVETAAIEPMVALCMSTTFTF